MNTHGLVINATPAGFRVSAGSDDGRELRVPARVCISLYTAQQHPKLNASWIPNTDHGSFPSLHQLASISAVLAVEAAAGESSAYAPWLDLLAADTLRPEPPQKWPPADQANLELADLHGDYWQTQSALLQDIARIAQGMLQASQGSMGTEIAWAAAHTLRNWVPGGSAGAVLCPLIDLVEVDPSGRSLENIVLPAQQTALGEQQPVIVGYKLPGTAQPNRADFLRKLNPRVEGGCAAQYVARSGVWHHSYSNASCFKLSLSVPNDRQARTAITMFRRGALQRAGLIHDAANSTAIGFVLQRSQSFLPVSLLQSVRLAVLRWDDAGAYAMQPNAQAPISLDNELAALRALRDAFRGRQAVYSAKLGLAVEQRHLSARVADLTQHQLTALQLNSATLEVAKHAEKLARQQWEQIFDADTKTLLQGSPGA